MNKKTKPFLNEFPLSKKLEKSLLSDPNSLKMAILACQFIIHYLSICGVGVLPSKRPGFYNEYTIYTTIQDFSLRHSTISQKIFYQSKIVHLTDSYVVTILFWHKCVVPVSALWERVLAPEYPGLLVQNKGFVQLGDVHLA